VGGWHHWGHRRIDKLMAEHATTRLGVDRSISTTTTHPHWIAHQWHVGGVPVGYNIRMTHAMWVNLRMLRGSGSESIGELMIRILYHDWEAMPMLHWDDVQAGS